MLKNRLLFLDYETYYDREYSLSKMPTPNYILDDRWETIMCAAREGMQPSRIIDGPDFGEFIAQYDPATTTTVTFNSLFDNSILAWKYGFVPHTMLDAMGMARAMLGHKLARFSLSSVAQYMGSGTKGGALVKVMGMRRAEIISRGLWTEFCDYAKLDNDLCADIFFKLIKDFPRSERRIMDLVLRCAVQPTFSVDIPMLKDHIKDVEKAKLDMLAPLNGGVVPATEEKAQEIISSLMSAAKFTAALEAHGVTVETKTSPTGRTVPAFAKTDEFMAGLLEHNDPEVQALAAARLGHKSTLEETRCNKILAVAELPWHNYRDGNVRLYPGGGGTLPMPLRYGGAHTHRLSGDWGLNVQNLPTARGSKGKSKLRKSLIVAPDESVVTADLGQIEARLAAWVCGCNNLLNQFRNKEDPYAILATNIFGFVVDRKVNIIEGFIGKTGILGLGYGCGVDHFYDMVIKLARASGTDVSKLFDWALAARSVATYRRIYSAIPQGWHRLDYLLKSAWLGKTGPMGFGPGNVVVVSHGEIKLPSGLSLNYGDPREDAETQELWYTFNQKPRKIYGASSLENIVQALARIVVMNSALRLNDRGYRFRLQAHDELVFIVKKADLDNAKKIIHTEMTRSPSWAPDLPLTADVKSGVNYGECT